jgi:hypothetical protein
MTSNLLNSLELSQQLNKTLMFSSRQKSWNGVLVDEQCQSPASAFEWELPTLSDHWLYFHTGDPSLFKQAMGVSPHQYVIQQRVEQAKLMLSKTDLAITLRDSFSTRRSANAYRRHCLTSRQLLPKSFNPTV